MSCQTAFFAGSERIERLSADLRDLPPDDASVWQRVQSEFQLSKDVIHMNNGSIGPSPRIVTESIIDALGKLEADPYHNTWGGLAAGMETTRTHAADFIGAELDEVSLIRNCTEGMNLIATGLDLEPGDEILTSNHEHGGGMVCWQYLRKHRGVKVNYLKMPNPVQNKQQLLSEIEKHLTPKTKLCSFMHVDTITGLQMPLADISELTRRATFSLSAMALRRPACWPSMSRSWESMHLRHRVTNGCVLPKEQGCSTFARKCRTGFIRSR